ncbi:hypothetical protein CEE69_15865 [Rhodopirellula bahusiensis]|uniref:Uncharacterized protein n=1 Tax=Rhodopirellula bahusiensis TaxID=2014065 RepID=A0A2G1W612_9BACT|nr:hypothetical protein CEE69_15865 [Rhodopirellula bahusiensis]
MGESVTDVTEIPEWNCVPRHVIQDAASVQSEDEAKSERVASRMICGNVAGHCRLAPREKTRGGKRKSPGRGRPGLSGSFVVGFDGCERFAS